MPNEFMFVIDADIVFVAVVVLSVFLRPPRINILLPQPSRILFPILRRLALFDPGVLFLTVALEGAAIRAAIWYRLPAVNC